MRGTLQDWEDDRAQREILADIGTLADLPEASEAPTVAPDEPETDEPTPFNLCEREHSGIRVSLDWHPALGCTILLAVGEETPYVFSVADDRALDAFHHPYAYDPRR